MGKPMMQAQSISEYILSLTILSVLSGAVMVFAPDNGIKKYLRCLVSLIIALTLLMPLKNVIFALPEYLKSMTAEIEISDMDDTVLPDSTELLVNFTAAQLADELENSIMRQFGITADVMLRFDTSDTSAIHPELVTVGLNESDRESANAIKLYISAELGCDVRIIIGGEDADETN